jgi:hypothetical protein
MDQNIWHSNVPLAANFFRWDNEHANQFNLGAFHDRMEGNLPTFAGASHLSCIPTGAVAFAAQSRYLITTILLVSLVHQRRPGRRTPSW